MRGCHRDPCAPGEFRRRHRLRRTAGRRARRATASGAPIRSTACVRCSATRDGLGPMSSARPRSRSSQARMGSTRLPGKVLRPILGRPDAVVHRRAPEGGARPSRQSWVATSDQPGDESGCARFCREEAIITCFSRQRRRDVLDRFLSRGREGKAAIRCCASRVIAPLVDPGLIERLLAMYAFRAVGSLSRSATGAGAGVSRGRPVSGTASTPSVFRLRRASRRAWA